MSDEIGLAARTAMAGRSARQLLCCLVLLMPAPAALADTQEHHARFVVELDAAFAEGDFDLERDTSIDSLTLQLRWAWQRTELHLSVPWLRLDGPGDTTLLRGLIVPDRTRLGRRRDADPGSETDESAVRRVSGLGDIVLGGEFHLLAGSARRPWVTARVSLKTASGDEALGLGSGGTDVEAGLSVAQPLGRIDLLLDASYTSVESSERFALRDTTQLGGGISMPFGRDYRQAIYGYLDHRSSAVRGFDDQRALILGGGSWLDAARRWRVSARLSVGLSDTAEDFGLGLRFAHRY